MERADLAHLDSLLAGFDPSVPVEEASTPPASWYTDPALFALERSAVLARAWQPACRLEQVVAPGEFAAGTTLGRPWAVVRGGDEELRAFHAVCRHHGTVLLRGAGRCEEIVCPYHGWTYSLAGRLTSAPRMAGVRCFAREDFGLVPLGHAELGPYVLLDLGGATAAHLEALRAACARLERPGERLRWRARRAYEVGCNWKVFADNYLDGGYHVAHAHRGLAAQLDLDSYSVELRDGWTLQRCRASGGERLGDEALYACVHPNLMLNRYGPVLDVNHVLPLAADRCQVVFDWFFEEGTSGELAAAAIEESEAVQREDVELSESVQAGLASPAYDRGRYAPRVEHAMHAFHVRIAAEIRAGIETERAKELVAERRQSSVSKPAGGHE